MSNKKICIITSVHSVFDVRIFHKEAKSLKGAGYDVTLIAQHTKSERIDGIDIVAIKPAKTRFERFFLVLPKVVKVAFGQKASVYHFHDPDLIVAALLLKIVARSIVIYDVHEDVPKQILSKIWIPFIVRKPISVMFNALEKNSAKFFDAVITATPSIAKEFNGCKVKCVANYPKLEYFKNFPARKRESSRISGFAAIYAGGISKIRGIKEIVEAYNLIDGKNGIKLVLAGSFSDDIFKKELTTNEGWKKVTYLGFLPLNDTYREMVVADVGLVCFLPEPNHTEALPNKIFEYMAAGIPVIASNFPLWKEIIEGNECGVCVDPNNPKTISEAITSIANNPGLAKEMGANGRNAVLNTYNWEKESKKLLEVYKILSK